VLFIFARMPAAFTRKSGLPEPDHFTSNITEPASRATRDATALSVLWVVWMPNSRAFTKVVREAVYDNEPWWEIEGVAKNPTYEGPGQERFLYVRAAALVTGQSKQKPAPR
jgi:hypothetical protein